MDRKSMRQTAIQMYGLTKADEAYTIYYDETNNDRRLHVDDDGFNVPELKCFVIGGIAHKGPKRPINIRQLRQDINMQANAPEMKGKHVGNGDFKRLLNSAKLETYLNWLEDEGFYIHFSVLDPLYWSIVDIVDSIVGESGEVQLLMYQGLLKNELYELFRHDMDRTVDIFQRYTYPNVGQEKQSAFFSELLNMLDSQKNEYEPVNYMMLKGLLQVAPKLESLPFLEDEKPNVLVDNFATFYAHLVLMLKNSYLVFDIEKTIQDRIALISAQDGITNYKFDDSKNDTGIQVADVITGLLGKMFTFLNQTQRSEIQALSSQLNDRQQRNLKKLQELLEKSEQENRIFSHFIMSAEDVERYRLLMAL